MSSASNLGRATFPTKPCYNCRRRRRRCDKSQPSCHRCSRDGEECLGYGRVLRWVDPPTAAATAAAGNLCRLSSQEHGGPCDAGSGGSDAAIRATALIRPALVDPLLSNLSIDSRYYIHHFSNVVCRDLVSIDQQDRNPFRSLVLLVEEHDFLQAIVLATSAMHLAVLYRHQGTSSRGALVDALSSKARAISLLRAALEQQPLVHKEILLAAMVFFINLDLIDSGRGGWKTHMQAAGSLISSFQTTEQQIDWTLAPMADAIAADCLTYRILGSTISSYEPDPAGSGLLQVDQDAAVFSILSRNEAHSYHCCPPLILQIIMSASRLFGPEFSAADGQARLSAAQSLLLQAREYDVEEWVYNISGLARHDDLPTRVKLASAHRAACCLYIVLAVSNDDEGLPDMPDTRPDGLAVEIYNSLASVPIDHVLLKGMVWPTFMAGAQTDDASLRNWLLERLRAILGLKLLVCPWGYVSTAIEMLDDIWTRRERVPKSQRMLNWLQELKGVRNGCLIV
ncbi:Fungal specific transcription factor domain containing protein [Rhypophila decipiens]